MVMWPSATGGGGAKQRSKSQRHVDPQMQAYEEDYDMNRMG